MPRETKAEKKIEIGTSESAGQRGGSVRPPAPRGIGYGKAGVLLEKADELFHGKTLAKTIAFAAVITASGLFFVAARVPD